MRCTVSLVPATKQVGKLLFFQALNAGAQGSILVEEEILMPCSMAKKRKWYSEC